MCEACQGNNWNCPVCGTVETEEVKPKDCSPLPYLDLKESLEEMGEILELANKFERRIKIYQSFRIENPKLTHKINRWAFFRNYHEKMYLRLFNQVKEVNDM